MIREEVLEENPLDLLLAVSSSLEICQLAADINVGTRP